MKYYLFWLRKTVVGTWKQFFRPMCIKKRQLFCSMMNVGWYTFINVAHNSRRCQRFCVWSVSVKKILDFSPFFIFFQSDFISRSWSMNRLRLFSFPPFSDNHKDKEQINDQIETSENDARKKKRSMKWYGKVDRQLQSMFQCCFCNCRRWFGSAMGRKNADRRRLSADGLQAKSELTKPDLRKTSSVYCQKAKKVRFKKINCDLQVHRVVALLYVATI